MSPGREAAPRVHGVPLPGVVLRVEESGAGAPVVLLHGLGGSAADWADVAPALASAFRVLAPDLRGSGASLPGAPGPGDLGRLADDVQSLLDALGAAPAHLVGWSLGGMVALELAARTPARVRSLVLVNTGPDFRPRTRAQRAAFAARGLATRLLPPALLARPLARKLFPGRDQAALRTRYAARLRGNDSRAYAALLDAILTWSVAERLPDLDVPTLVVASERDYLAPAQSAAWVARLPRARLRVVPGGHALPFEAPGLLVEELLGFLGAHDGPPKADLAGGPAASTRA